MKKKFIAFAAIVSALPMLAFAASYQSLGGILGLISQVLAALIPILIAFAAVYFIWNVIMYLISGDEEKKKSARSGIINGLIGLFIIVAFWGIIHTFENTIGISNSGSGLSASEIPTVPCPSGIGTVGNGC